MHAEQASVETRKQKNMAATGGDGHFDSALCYCILIIDP
jgi:hypothetical protein